MGEGFEIGMRTVASGNPGGSKGWEEMGQEEVILPGEGDDEVEGEGEEEEEDMGRGEKDEWGGEAKEDDGRKDGGRD